MELKLAKGLSALALLISSLFFGLLVPFLLLKSKIGYKQPPFQNEDTASTDTGVLLDDSDSTTELNTSNRQQSGKWESFKNFFYKQYTKLCSYDIISFINCFSGGLFLGISLLGLLPESNEDVNDILKKKGIDTKFHISEFLVSLGLLFVMLIEQIVSATCAQTIAELSHDYHTSDQNSRVDSIQQISSTRHQNHSGDDQHRAQNPNSTANISADEMPNSSSAEPEVHQAVTSRATRSLVLITMLSVHSIFEGLALGLASTASALIQLLIGIIVHKSIIAFGLGMKLFEAFARHRVKIAVLCVVIFCIASPIGCTIGLFLTPTNDNSTSSVIQSPIDPSYNLKLNNSAEVSGQEYASAILQCLATGTFIFVTFIEVIPSEFSHTDNHGLGHGVDETVSRNEKLPIKPAVKFVALILGFSAIAGLQFV